MDKLTYPGSLHNHTDFSNFRLRDSINTVESLIDYAVELGHEVVAITEHDTIASAMNISVKTPNITAKIFLVFCILVPFHK